MEGTMIILKKKAEISLHIVYLLTIIFICGKSLYGQEASLKINKSDTATIHSILQNGSDFFDKNQLDSASILFAEGLNRSQLAGYSSGIAKALYLTSVLYGLKSDYAKAIPLLKQAAFYVSKNADDVLRANIYNNLGDFYSRMGMDDSSAHYLYTAVRDMEEHKVGDPDVLSKVYGRMLFFWINTANDDEDITQNKNINLQSALSYLRKMEFKDSADASAYERVLFYKGVMFGSMKKWDSTLYFYSEYIRTKEKKGEFTTWVSAAYMNIADGYIKQGKPAKALPYIQKGRLTSIKNGFKNHQVSCDMFEGMAYNQLGKYQQAQVLLEGALEKARQLNMAYEIHNIYKALAVSYKGTGNFQKAYQAQEAYTKRKDSLLNREKINMVSQLEIVHRVAEKDKELERGRLQATVAKDKITARNFWITGISITALLTGLLLSVLYRNSLQKQKLQKEKEKLQNEQIETLQKQMEINRLMDVIQGEEKERARLARELHDGIGGTLAAVRLKFGSLFSQHNLGHETETASLMTMLDEASSEVRKTAHNLMPEILLQEGLVSATKMFCDRIESSHTLDVRFQTVGQIPALPAGYELTIYRIVQELLHNVVKHAQATEAIVQFQAASNSLDITVEDNGRGLPEKTGEKSTSFNTIRQRVKSLNGTFDIYSQPEAGTTAELAFPLPETPIQHANGHTSSNNR